MSAISTHVLDTARGCPAAGLGVTLEQGDGRGTWRTIGEGDTDRDGRLRTLMKEGASLVPGPYRLTFDTRRYFESNRMPVFYPSITVTFETGEDDARYHVPLLISPFGYTTYRGS
jgi:5-hydroxyisourate hydrolase